MNLGTYLLVTVPLVGGSLYVYDTLRSDPAPVILETSTADAPPRASPAPEGTGPLLQPDTSGQTERIVREAVERMRRELASSASKGVLPSSGTDGGLPANPPLALGSEPEAVEGPSATFDEKTMRVFRAYLEEAQRLNQEEERARRIQDALTNMNVSLTDAQRNAVVSATLKLRADARDLPKRYPGAENVEARKKAGQDLREAYSKTIHDIAPAVEAEKIVNELASFRGWMDGAQMGAGGGFQGRGGAGGRTPPGGSNR